MTERRREARSAAAAMRVSQAILRPGRHVQVLDLSPGGVRVKCDVPLRPGRRVHLRLIVDSHCTWLAALIVWCAVYEIHPNGSVAYRAALCFDERCARLDASRASPG